MSSRIDPANACFANPSRRQFAGWGLAAWAVLAGRGPARAVPAPRQIIELLHRSRHSHPVDLSGASLSEFDLTGIDFKSAQDASQWLITEKLISTVPWDDAGAYLRFSVTFLAKGQADEQRVLLAIANRFNDVRFEF